MTRLIFTLCLGTALCSAPAYAQKAPETQNPAANAVMSVESRFHPVYAANGMVSAQDRIAAEVGRDILAAGGNAVDAAVAVGFALTVTHPQAGNIGGGGFMMYAPADSDEVIALDFRETAPAGASRDMFLGEDGEVDNNRARFSHLSAGVPGTVAGLLYALDKYGTEDRQTVLKPAVSLAANGFPMSYGQSASFTAHKKRLSKDPSSVDYFFDKDGNALRPGQTLKQKDLAATLKRIARKGRDGFYKGRTADLLLAEMKAGGGVMSQADLDAYKPKERKAVRGTYKGYEVWSMPPPSSGGVHVVQMLNMLSGYDLKADGHNSAAYIHKLAEVMRRAYADRSEYLGDPDFWDVPVAALTDPAYAARLRAGINTAKASKSADIKPGLDMLKESPQTTHYSVMDKDGNAVAVTYTLNFSYGSGHSVDGAGFLLNNQMDDFSAKPGAPNGYGLVGGEANKIEPRKRPLSSMTPLILKKDGDNVLATGSIGGSTIITAVLQMVLNTVEFDMNVAQATNMPRVHHQWLPDVLTTEPGIGRDTLNDLEGRGFVLPKTPQGGYEHSVFGRVNSVAYRDGVFQGASDPRSPKAAAVGY